MGVSQNTELGNSDGLLPDEKLGNGLELYSVGRSYDVFVDQKLKSEQRKRYFQSANTLIKYNSQ